MSPRRRPSRVQQLRSVGFDMSSAIPFRKLWKVKCSGCVALIINGIPTHERGCPNEPRAARDAEDE